MQNLFENDLVEIEYRYFELLGHIFLYVSSTKPLLMRVYANLDKNIGIKK